MIAPNEQIAGGKSPAPYLKSRDDAERSMNELAQAENNRRKLISRMDAEILRIKEAHAAGITECDEFIAVHSTALQAWADGHPEEFPKDKKSIELTSGTLGFRLDPPSLALQNRTVTWAKILTALAARKWRKFIRIKPEVDKVAILARCGTKENPTLFQKRTLPTLGIKLVQEEKFFLEATLTDTEVRK